MANFKHYFMNDFAGCRLIAKAFDQHRHREVSIYLLPGQFEYVGVSDGTDKWIAPVIAEPFSVNIREIILAIQNKEEIKLPVIAKSLKEIETEKEAPIRKRRTLLSQQPEPSTSTSGTRRRLVEISEPQAQARSRRAILN